MSARLSARALAVAHAYWSRDVGFPIAQFEVGRVRIVHQAGKASLFSMALDGTAVIVAPPDVPEEPLSLLTPAQAIDPAWLSPILGSRLDRFVGPAFVGYADETTMVRSTGQARLLTTADTAAVEALRRTCSAQDWEHGGGELGRLPAAGAWEGERLAALATFRIWDAVIAHLSIVADPALRGKGHARAAVGLLARLVLQEGLLPQYRTLAANAPSMSIATALGFVEYATTLAARLLPPG